MVHNKVKTPGYQLSTSFSNCSHSIIWNCLFAYLRICLFNTLWFNLKWTMFSVLNQTDRLIIRWLTLKHIIEWQKILILFQYILFVNFMKIFLTPHYSQSKYKKFWILKLQTSWFSFYWTYIIWKCIFLIKQKN